VVGLARQLSASFHSGIKGTEENKLNAIICSLFDEGTDIQGVWKQSAEETKY
jgi:hypothetical protein